MGSKFQVYSIFKPNTPLANVTEDVRKLGEDLTKQDHVFVVGAGNSLDTNQYYSTDKDVSFNAERTSDKCGICQPPQEI
jgi:glycerol dehydrogenase-like iron-containing ADH family enzyme